MKNLKTFVGKLEAIFSMILVFIFEIGSVLYYERSFTLKYTIIDVLLIIIIAFGLSFLNRIVTYLKEAKLDDFLEKNFFKASNIIFACLILVIVYFMCYISYYPGIDAYDISSSFFQIKYNNYGNLQPITYTLLVKFILWLAGGNYTNMLIMYSIFQMIFVIVVSFYSLFWLYKNKACKLIIIAGYFYFLFMPVLHIFSIITTKDVLFSCFFLLFSMNFIDFGKHFCKKNMFFFLLNGLLACLMRNNMVYVLVLFCIALLFKKASKEIIWCNLILIVIFYSTQLFFYNRCHFGKSPIGETLCVPINQMAYVYVNRDNLSNEEKEKIIFYIPEAQNYNPRFIDPVKGCFNQEGYNISKNEFWKLYLSLLKKYPFDYIKAFLNTNLPYWFVKAEIPDHYSQRAYIETYNLYPDKNEFPILRRQNYLKSLNDYYESIANFNNRVLKIFPFSLLFSLSFPFLSLIVCLYLSIKLNICDLIWIYILYLLLLFTYILGPVSNFRYVYTYYLCLPFYFGIIFRRIKEKK